MSESRKPKGRPGDKRTVVGFEQTLFDAIAQLAISQDRSFAAQVRVLCRAALSQEREEGE